MRFNLPKLLALLFAMISTACAPTLATVPARSIPCVSVEALTFDSEADTPATIRGVRGFNAVFDRLCP